MKKSKSNPASVRPAKTARKDDFESVAKWLGCDDDKDHFEAKLGKIAKVKPVARKRQRDER